MVGDAPSNGSSSTAIDSAGRVSSSTPGLPQAESSGVKAMHAASGEKYARWGRAWVATNFWRIFDMRVSPLQRRHASFASRQKKYATTALKKSDSHGRHGAPRYLRHHAARPATHPQTPSPTSRFAP